MFISKLDARGQSIEERRSEGYIDFMTDVWLACEDQMDGLLRAGMGAINLEALQNKRSNLIWFTLEEDGKSYDLPFDFEFTVELDRDLVTFLCQELKNSGKRLSLRNKMVLRKLQQKVVLGETEYKLSFLNVFKEVTLILKKIQDTINAAQNFKGGPAALRTLHQGFYIPNETHFRLLVMQKVLEDPKHRHHKEAMFHLKHSYFKGSLESFNSSLKLLFIRLNKGATMLADKADEITQTPLRSMSRWSKNSLRPWYVYDFVQDEGAYNANSFSKKTLLWMNLQRQEFDVIKEYWNSDRFDDRLKKARQGHNTQAVATSITRLVLEVRDKIESSCPFDGEVFVALTMERHFDFQTQEEYDRANNWVWENRLRLTHVLEDALTELDSRRNENKEIHFPKNIEDALDVAREQPAAHDARARREIENLLYLPDPEGKQKEFLNMCQTGGPNLVDSLWNLWQEIKDATDKYNARDLTWFAKLRAAYPKWSDMENELRTSYLTFDKLERLRFEIEQKVIEIFDHLGINLTGVPEEKLEILVGMWRRDLERRLSRHELDAIAASRFQELLDRSSSQQPEEALCRLEFMLRLVNCMPPLTDLVEGLASWLDSFTNDQLETLEDSIEYVREDYPNTLESLPFLIRNQMVKALIANSDSDTGSMRHRWQTFGIWQNSADHLEESLSELVRAFDSLTGIRDGQEIAVALRDLQSLILKAQTMFRPDRDELQDLELVLWPFEDEDKMADARETYFPLSVSLRSMLHQDLKDNFERLTKLKKKADMDFYQLREEQKPYGFSEDYSHLRVSLDIHDIEALKKTYSLNAKCDQECLQRFAAIYQLRREKTAALMEHLAKHHANPLLDGNHVKDAQKLFHPKQFESFRDKKFIDPKLRLALLYGDPDFLDTETHYLARFLNYARSGDLVSTPTFQIYMKLFQLVSPPNRQTRTWLRRLWGKLKTRLLTFATKDLTTNFQANQDMFFREARKILKTKLD